MAKEIKTDFRRKKEAYLFALWCSIPMGIRNLTPAKLKKDGYGKGDIELELLLTFKTQRAFAEHFQVSEEQLSRWKDDPKFLELVKEFSKMNHVDKFRDEIYYRFSKKTAQTADAQRAKLWFERWDDWRPGIDVSGELPYVVIVEERKEGE